MFMYNQHQYCLQIYIHQPYIENHNHRNEAKFLQQLQLKHLFKETVLDTGYLYVWRHMEWRTVQSYCHEI
jgi:hypothetical protein